MRIFIIIGLRWFHEIEIESDQQPNGLALLTGIYFYRKDQENDNA